MLRVRVTLGDGCDGAEHVGAEAAMLRLRTGGCLHVHAAARTAHLRVPRRLTSEELVHPYLGPAAAIAAHWEGWTAFHAGGVAIGGGVWGLIGDRELGKSSLLAHLAHGGHEVVADDVLVLRPPGTALAGPRSIDLRESAAAALGLGQGVGWIGARERWRVALSAIAPELPFRGWVFLAWGDTPEVSAVRPSESLSRLLRALTLRVNVVDPAAILGWAMFPAYSFTRPRDWSALESGAEVLVAGLAVADGPRAR